MHEAERERDFPPVAALPAVRSSPEVFGGDIDDAHRDRTLDQPRGQRHEAERGGSKRQGVRDRERGDDLQQVEKPPHEQQREEKRDVIVAEKDVAEAEPKVFAKLLEGGHAVAGVEKIVRLKAREDDFIFASVPDEGAQHDMPLAQGAKEIEGQSHRVGGVEQRVAKCERGEPLRKFVHRYLLASIRRPCGRLERTEEGGAIVELDIDVVP